MSTDAIVEEIEVTEALSEPDPELAGRLLESVDFDHRLMGMKMAAMGGTNAMALYSLREAASFIHVDPYEVVMFDQNATVGYIDPTMLAKWIDEVLDDAELAEAVRAEAGKAEFYGAVAMPIKAVLGQRLEQARGILDADANSGEEDA